MTNTGKQIASLLMETGKTAPDMTHALKILGNGSMEKGFAKIGTFFEEEIAIAAAKELSKGRAQGVIGTLGILFIGGIIYVITKKKEKAKHEEAKHEEEGQEIIKAIEYSSVDSTEKTEDRNLQEDQQAVNPD